jgi:hypothetical protein
MFSAYERANAEGPECALCCADDGEYFFPGYEFAEFCLRVGVDSDTLRHWSRVYGRGPAYAAIDVVRFQALARLVRSGVPVARAAVLLRLAEARVTSSFPVMPSLPKTDRSGPNWICHDTTAQTR